MTLDWNGLRKKLHSYRIKKIKEHYYRIITRNTEDPNELLIQPNTQTLSVDRQSQLTTTATASGSLPTPSPTPAAMSRKPSTMPLLENTGKRRSFTYITVSGNVVKELLKLHGIEFNGRKLVIDNAKTPPKKTTGKNMQALPQTKLPAIDFEMETFEPVPLIQRIIGSYRNTVLPKSVPLHFFQTA